MRENWYKNGKYYTRDEAIDDGRLLCKKKETEKKFTGVKGEGGRGKRIGSEEYE